MKYIPFGNTQVSSIGVGTMRIAGMTPEQADTFVRAALAEGINFFDHADIYGGGRSEEIFGTVLAKDPALRDKMFIQSKCAIHDGMYDFSKDYILQSVDGILSRLKTDHLDALLLHRPDVLMEPEEVGEAFAQLKSSGKVLQFGVSNMNRWQMELLESGCGEKLQANQMQLSIAHAPMIDEGINVNTAFDGAAVRTAGVLEYCRMHDMVLETWSPLQKGFFGGVFLNDSEYSELNEYMDTLAEEYQVSKDTIAYAWILRLPAKMQVITGTTNPSRLHNAALAADITLTRKQWYELYKAAGRRLP